ncbi:MAG: hypothetical protein FWG63_05255, partial [Defluviitaleaceae bacterium]|nr:hypothetical protein [Defluviitaleaceae bacterium]
MRKLFLASKYSAISSLAIILIMIFIQINGAESYNDGFVMVSVGFVRTFAIDANGDLWAWGSNEYGALGDGTFTSMLENNDGHEPVKIMNQVVYVTAGSNFA